MACVLVLINGNTKTVKGLLTDRFPWTFVFVYNYLFWNEMVNKSKSNFISWNHHILIFLDYPIFAFLLYYSPRNNSISKKMLNKYLV